VDEETSEVIERVASNQVHQWERRLLIAAFGGWAFVVAAYGQAAISRIDKIVDAMNEESKVNLATHQAMDRRLTIVEQRQDGVLRALARIEAHIDEELRQRAAQ
jgi:hypothetical protein